VTTIEGTDTTGDGHIDQIESTTVTAISDDLLDD
jgi:hypothetical protein